MRILPVLFVAFAALPTLIAQQSSAHFGTLQMNTSSASAVSHLHCELIMCAGRENGRYVQTTLMEGKIVGITVLYNAKKLDGTWEVSHTEDLTEAIRENSFANSHALPKFGIRTNDNGNTEAWVDKTNRIVYQEDPDDPDKGIIKVVYVQADAPILKVAHESQSLDDLIAKTYVFIYDSTKR